MALRRRFSLSERINLDLRAEYINVLNHPMFAAPANLWSASGATALLAFGKVTPGNTLNVGGGGPSGGQAPIYAPGGSRSAQFTFQLSF